ncbi:MAG TPA: sigma-70 family RNA polymerase sigma factor [Puia sp.]|nr:sigma-70 family RNA polymerase sigma factor [Puia sp.]
MSESSQHSDKELLLRIAEGDAAAFSTLFYRWHQQLAEYVLRLTRSQCMTEEIVQDAFLKIWIKKEQLAEVENFRAWLFILCRNHTFNCLRQLARNNHQQQAWITQVIQQAHAGETAPADPYYALLEEAVHRLSPQQRTVYLLSRRDGLKQEDIARRLQLSRHTVKRHMSLALQAIETYIRIHAPQALPLLILLLINS